MSPSTIATAAPQKSTILYGVTKSKIKKNKKKKNKQILTKVRCGFHRNAQKDSFFYVEKFQLNISQRGGAVALVALLKRHL